MNVSAAAIDITPDFEVELCGFAAREHPCAGVLDPLSACAIFIDDSAEKLLWITCDLIALEGGFVDPFRQWARRELNLAPHQVLICCTHTHSAPATIHLTAAGTYSDEYIALLRSRLQQLTRAVTLSAEPCRVASASSPLDLAIDRRGKLSAHVDSVVWAIRFERDDGTSLAVVANYAMHPVALGPVNRMISPDWCGAAASEISSRLLGKPIAIITNGAAGNLNPPAENIPPEEVAGYGRQVADAAIEALASATSQSARLRVRSISVPVQLESLDAAGIDRAADAFAARIGPEHPWRRIITTTAETWRHAMKRTIATGGAREVEIELQAIRIGDVTIVAVNGEMFSRFTALLRERLATANIFVIGYANAAFGYIPTRAAFAEGGYEVEEAHFFYNSFPPKVGSLEMLVDRAIELVKSL